MTNVNPAEIREEGFRVLAEGLGTAGAVNFLRQFDAGRGNYTEEREKLLGGITIDEIVGRIRERKRLGEHFRDGDEPA